MSIDFPPRMLDPEVLGSLPVEQLVAIVMQQQQMIGQLAQEVIQAQTTLELNHKIRPPAIALPQPIGKLQSIPHLDIKSEAESYRLPLVGSSYWTIGRSEDNMLVLPDQWMSRNHAMLQSMGLGDFFLIDLGSRNGSFVNGRRVSIPMALQDGDRLTFGQTELEFYCPLGVAAASPLVDSTLHLETEAASATALLNVRRLISVLVVDIRNFTILTRRLDECLLSEVIGTWFRCAGEIIRDYGSWVDKYIGDAVMAVWIHGTREVTREEMQRIFHALKALNEMTNQLHLSYPLPFPLKIGAGINTGYAMVGNAGSGDRPDYTALGDTVNAAFHLETCTKQLGLDIALGATTYQYLMSMGRDSLPFRQYTVNLKGYDTPTPTYVGSFADLNTLLQIRLRVDDTLY